MNVLLLLVLLLLRVIIPFGIVDGRKLTRRRPSACKKWELLLSWCFLLWSFLLFRSRRCEGVAFGSESFFMFMVTWWLVVVVVAMVPVMQPNKSIRIDLEPKRSWCFTFARSLLWWMELRRLVHKASFMGFFVSLWLLKTLYNQLLIAIPVLYRRCPRKGYEFVPFSIWNIQVAIADFCLHKAFQHNYNIYSTWTVVSSSIQSHCQSRTRASY